MTEPRVIINRTMPPGTAMLHAERAIMGPSDRDLLVLMYEGAGVSYTEAPPEPDSRDMEVEGATTVVTVTERDGAKGVIGYNDFYCQHFFDEQGRLLKVGVWE